MKMRARRIPSTSWILSARSKENYKTYLTVKSYSGQILWFSRSRLCTRPKKKRSSL